jgi:hypothetical protein
MKWWRSVTSNFSSRLPLWIAALWWGSLSTIGFLVVPLLFVHLPSPALAGGMAAKLFSAQTWVSTVAGLLLLMLLNKQPNQPLVPVQYAKAAIIFIVGGMLLALLSEFAVAPKIVARQNLMLWHNVGSALYLLQWVCAAVVFGKLLPPRAAPVGAASSQV